MSRTVATYDPATVATTTTARKLVEARTRVKYNRPSAVPAT